MTEQLIRYNHNRACPKCGQKDTVNQFHKAGEYRVRDSWGASYQPFSQDTIVRHCRNCHYQWEELPLDGTPAKDAFDIVEEAREAAERIRIAREKDRADAINAELEALEKRLKTPEGQKAAREAAKKGRDAGEELRKSAMFDMKNLHHKRIV
jgi:predicted nucleic-acid-binding Zn-ribbon protein